MIRGRVVARSPRGGSWKGLRQAGEVAERSKALDWNSSNIFTGVRGFESHPLRQHHVTRNHGGPHRFLRDDQS
jgi:hypothetical protein